MKKFTTHLFLAAALSLGLYSCSENDRIEEEILQDLENEQTNSNDLLSETAIATPENTISINAGVTVGSFYNFWSTRPMINQTRFNSVNFRNNIASLDSYVKSYNIVRLLGGRQLRGEADFVTNNFYKGVDNEGNIITDFTELTRSLDNFMLTGFKPRIVLDNVPWDLSAQPLIVDRFGNSRPPEDYNLWRQYINAFLQTLVDNYGLSEVETWRFRITTEPNFNPGHWRGTPEQFFMHYDITVDEVLKVIPNAIVGPGNLLTEGNAAAFTTELIDHCATGTNFATGGTGTQMDFFSLSYYERIRNNNVKFASIVAPYRNSLNSYPQFANIPFDIQEFGIVADENGTVGQSLNDGTELGASWYAAIVDMAFDNRISEIYDWGQEIESTGNLPAGRRNVTEMFLKLEDGTRLQATDPQSVDNISSFAGAIPVSKDGKLYILIYNHNASRTSTGSRTLYPQIEGGDVANFRTWTMNEWTIDANNGIFLHELYDDLRAAGVTENTNGRIYGNRTSDRFDAAWEDVFTANRSKYETLAELPQTISDEIIERTNGKLELEVDLAPHSVKLIELIPSNTLSTTRFD